MRFLTAVGRWVNNIDLTHALAALPLSRYTVHQTADASITLRLAPGEMMWAGDAANRISAVLEGREVLTAALENEGKLLQYASDLKGGLCE